MLQHLIVGQSLSPVWLFSTPWTAPHQASLSFTISQSLFKLMSIEMMPFNHLIFCHPLLLLPFLSIREWFYISVCFKLIDMISLVMMCQLINTLHAAAAAKSLQSCPTMCDPIDSSPPGSPVPGILQARILEWVAISFSNAWRWKWKWSRSVVSDSERPHGLQPTGLLHPWDFPGKSTGVGCHHLLRIHYIVLDYIPHPVHFITLIHLFTTGTLYILISLTYSFPLFNHLPSVKHLFVLLSITLFCSVYSFVLF